MTTTLQTLLHALDFCNVGTLNELHAKLEIHTPPVPPPVAARQPDTARPALLPFQTRPAA